MLLNKHFILLVPCMYHRNGGPSYHRHNLFATVFHPCMNAFCGVTSWKRNHNSVFLIAPQARLLFTFLPLLITSYHPPSPLSPLKQVAIEAMDKKTFDLSSTVQMDPPDLKRLQLLLQGSISTQVRPPSCRIFLWEGILYEMDQIVSVRL